METASTKGLTRRALRWQAFLILLTANTVGSQQIPSLQTTAPANGSVVSPGGTLTLTIDSSPAGTAFSQIAIIGPAFFGINTIAPTSLPTQFSLTIPPDADSRVYTLTVEGVPVSGPGATPAQLQVDVEHSDAVVALSTSPTSLTFQSQGERSSLSLAGTFAITAVTVDVTESTRVSYTSSNIKAATVDSSGNVFAVAPGNATITATYGQGAQSLSVSVPVSVLPPRLTASATSLSFSPQPLGTTSAAQDVTLTNTATGPINAVTVSAAGEFKETDDCASLLPLAVGSDCTAKVSFAPGGTGTRTGSITVASSVATVPLVVSLTGTGIAPSYVQGNSGFASFTGVNSITSATVQYTGAQTAGNLNVVVVAWVSSSPTQPVKVQSVTDTTGNFYKLAVGPTELLPGAQSIYYARIAGASFNSVTVTFASAVQSGVVQIAEYSGVNGTSPLDAVAANTDSPQNPITSGSATTTNVPDLLVGAAWSTNLGATGPVVPGTGFTSRILTSPGTHLLEDEIVTANGRQSATAVIDGCSLSNPCGYIMQMLALRGAP